MIDRAICEAAFREAVLACDPAVRVRAALDREPLHGGEVIGLAIGKAALAMARGAGPVARGLVVTIVDDGRGLPPGWTLVLSSHPVVSEKSVEAGQQALRLVESATAEDVVLALVSGGASALVEVPAHGLTLDAFRARVQELMASGAPIAEINALRTQLSALKGGQLAARSPAPVVTLVVSDVIGDDPRVIGSGPTIRLPPHPGDRVEVIAPIAGFGEEVAASLTARGIAATRLADAVADDVGVVAERLVAGLTGALADPGPDRSPGGERAAVVAWGEPTVRVPEAHGQGGRAQQLALELARRLRGSSYAAFVAGSDGLDGPPQRPAAGASPRGAAGAYVDGATWDAISAAGIDPAAALRRCDAGTALDAVGALVITGPTGINHADVMIVG
jgi:hydroxypyruvate reductase